MIKTFKTGSLDDLKSVAKGIAQIIKESDPTFNIMLFRGSMGAGKTTFIKYLCHYLDVVDVVTSPTFAIINEYKTKTDDSIYHFDLYRIESEKELFDLGYEEYFYSSNLSLIEWPENAEQIIPYDDPSIKIGTVSINVLSPSDREITFKDEN